MAHHSGETFFQRLHAFDDFYEPVHREIIDWLKPPQGARIADIGCGAGGMSLLFAEAVGDSGSVAALEPGAERVSALRERLETVPQAARISVYQGELPALPFENDEFELTWCSRVVHHLADQVAGIRELARITKKGGRVVLREGDIAARFLPYDVGLGQPGIQDRVQVAQNVWFDSMLAGIENRVPYPYGWLQALRDAGLRRVVAKSFLYELNPPFTPAQTAYFRGWLNDVATHEDYPLGEADRSTLRELTDPDSAHDAFRRDDLHLWYVATIYVGQVG